MNETKRLYGVLDAHLAKHEYLAGNYGLADIKTFGWARLMGRVGVNPEEFPNVQAWIARIEAREAVKAGLNVASD